MANTRLSAWKKVEIARDPKRKTSLDYIEEIFDDFIEFLYRMIFPAFSSFSQTKNIEFGSTLKKH